MSAGSIYKRCGCKERRADGTRRSLGAQCPKLRRADGSWNPRHGTWTYKTTARDSNGKRKQITEGGFPSAADAQSALDKRRSQLQVTGGTFHGVTVAGWLNEWLDGKVDLRPNTLHTYRLYIDRYLIPRLGRHRLEDLRATHVAAMLQGVTGAVSAHRVRATLRSALGDAMRHGLVTVNVASLVKLPSGRSPRALVWTTARVEHWRRAQEQHDVAKAAGITGPALKILADATEPPSSVMCWTPAQLSDFLSAARNDEQYALWHVLALRGLRRGEACGLEWRDVDLDAGTAAIVRQRIVVGNKVKEGPPKSHAGQRVIALDSSTVAVLREHRRKQLERRLALGSVWIDSGKVFCRATGAALDPHAISKRFRALIKASDLPPIRLHDLRHGAASLMIAAGVDMKVIQETLGHSSMTLTANTYTSVYPDVAQDAANKAASLVQVKDS